MDAPRSVTGFADVNGARLAYEVAGEGHPLVLVHAGVADMRMWDDQFPVFARHFRTIRYDLRGFGGSPMPPGRYAMRDDLRALLDTLGVARAHVVGVSMGGGIAVDFALAHPAMVTALVPVASGLGGRGRSPELRALQDAIAAAEDAGDFERAADLDLRLWVDGPYRAPEQVDAGVRGRVRRMLLDNAAHDHSASTPDRLDPPAVGRLGEISVPTLVIHGDADVPDVAATAAYMAAEIPGARSHVFPGAAHMLTMERPDEFNRVVLDFLRAV